MIRVIPASLAVALSLSPFLWLSGALSFPLALASVTVFALVVMAAGFLLLRLVRAQDWPATAAWVIGLFATASVVYALVALLGVLAINAFAVWAVLVAGCSALWGGAPAGAPASQLRELGGLLLCAAATALWCRDMAEVPRMLAEHGVLSTWTDQFIHGSVISQFGDPRAAGRHAIQIADLPLPPYHYASYVLPAVFAAPLDLPGLTLATSLWVPMGFFTLCAGAFSLGGALGRTPGAIAALAALSLVPDAASYGLFNRLFGFYWYVIAIPGAAYALGMVLLAIAFLRRWCVERDRAALAASGILVVGSVLVRLHVFALAFPAWLACVALATPVVRHHWRMSAALASAAFLLFVWAFYALVPDAHWALPGFLDITHNQQQPVPYRGLYQGLMVLYGAPLAMTVGVLLIIPACLGIFLVLYPVSLVLARRSGRFAAIDAMPPIVLLCYLLLVLAAPVPGYGDATELTQRPFVLVYAVFAIWTAVGFTRWIAARRLLSVPRMRIVLVAAAALTVLAVLRYTVRDWRWEYSYTVAEGLPQAAQFIRTRWRPGDTLAAEGLQATLTTTDVAIQLVALTGIPAYLAMPLMQSTRGGRYAEASSQRYAALQAVDHEATLAAALRRLKRLGIRWYVVAERDRSGPRWDPQRRAAAFADRMVAVYEVR